MYNGFWFKQNLELKTHGSEDENILLRKYFSIMERLFSFFFQKLGQDHHRRMLGRFFTNHLVDGLYERMECFNLFIRWPSYITYTAWKAGSKSFSMHNASKIFLEGSSQKFVSKFFKYSGVTHNLNSVQFRMCVHWLLVVELVRDTQAYSKPCQTTKMELLAKITVLAMLAVLDVIQGSEYVS